MRTLRLSNLTRSHDLNAGTLVWIHKLNTTSQHFLVQFLILLKQIQFVKRMCSSQVAEEKVLISWKGVPTARTGPRTPPPHTGSRTRGPKVETSRHPPGKIKMRESPHINVSFASKSSISSEEENFIKCSRLLHIDCENVSLNILATQKQKQKNTYRLAFFNPKYNCK